MRHDITFLHTSPVHVATFDALMRTAAPALRVAHVVREDLLADAQREGVDSPPLVARVQRALALAEARVVVCTCSTLGGIAEDTPTGGAFHITRIDRAMADAAVRSGQRVLLVATVSSTVQPTTALLQSSATGLGHPVVIEALWVADAWPYFQAGRHREHVDAIVRAVLPVAAGFDSVVLAQASMAPAAAVLAERGILALTSPHLGVQHAIALLSRSMPNP